MEALIGVMEQIGNTPFDVKAYPKYIKLCKEQEASSSNASNGYESENDATQNDGDGPLTSEARGMMVNALGATADVWIPLLKYKARVLDAANNEEAAQELLNLFSTARGDYLSIPVLELQAQAIIDLNERFRTQPPEEKKHYIWSDENVRGLLEEIASLSSQHITKSHYVWDLRLHWELERLEELSSLAENDPMKVAEKEQAIIRIDEMFIGRLKQPHSHYTNTSDLYSPFVSTYFDPSLYESKLVAATKARELPIKQLAWREGNPKRVRENLELSAVSGGVREWKQYLNWEMKAKKPQRRFIIGVYERALECAARERWQALSQLATMENEENKERSKATEAVLAELWEEYLTYSAQSPYGEIGTLLRLAKRATRCLPESGKIWAFYMRTVEKANTPPEDGEAVEWEETVEEISSRALDVNLLQSSLEDLVLFILTRASWSRRKCFVKEEGETVVDEEQMNDVIRVLDDGIAAVRKLEGGDPKMRLEGFLSAFYQSLPLSHKALEVLQSATKFYKTSYLSWLNYIDLLLHEKNILEARRVFKDASQRKGIDWPEAIWDRWLLFEYQFGSIEDIEKATSAVKDFKRREDERRSKAWQAHAAAYSASVGTNGAATDTVAVESAQAPTTDDATQPPVLCEDGMDVDAMAVVSPERQLKRKRSEDEQIILSPSPKKAKHEGVVLRETGPTFPAIPPPTNEAATLKRDRERTTVLVSHLPQVATQDDVRKLFKDCGDIREIVIKKLPNELVATVEFMERESIPAALTRDKKRIHGNEVSVNVGWQSTLYVTNFREGMDDSEMRSLFEKYGTILDVRWPSKRIKTTRRFCYVQFTTSAAARDALYLDGFEVEPGLKLSVLVSDPTRKKERTDTGARELRVTGVVKTVTKADLEKLFVPYGPLKDIRMVPALGNNQTAFVEYESEESAQAGLAVNNQMLKGRRLAVVMADPKPARAPQALGTRQETIGRSIRIRNVPDGTQEAVLQQALEKVTSVSKLQLFPDRNEAILELMHVSDAGRLLLEHSTLEFNGATLTLREEEKPGQAAARGRGKGRGRGLPGVSFNRSSEPTVSSTGSSKSAGHFRVGTRPGLGMKKEHSEGTAHEDSATKSVPKSQDDFRKMLGL